MDPDATRVPDGRWVDGAAASSPMAQTETVTEPESITGAITIALAVPAACDRLGLHARNFCITGWLIAQSGMTED